MHPIRQRGFRRKGQFLDRYENGGRIRHHGADYVLLPGASKHFAKGVLTGAIKT